VTEVDISAQLLSPRLTFTITYLSTLSMLTNM